MRRIPLIVFAGLLSFEVGCNQTPPVTPVDDETAKKNLREQAEQLIAATLAEDHDRAATFTHPKLIQLTGGKEKYIRVVKGVAADLRKDGGELQKMVLGDTPAIAQANGEFFGVVHYNLYMTMNKTKMLLQPAYFVAHSTDGGRNWTFLDGAGLKDDRAKLRQLIPNFPDSLELPKGQLPTLLWG